ncbi:MAG: MaoC family dehydratase, partial [Rhodopila sp.]
MRAAAWPVCRRTCLLRWIISVPSHRHVTPGVEPLEEEGKVLEVERPADMKAHIGKTLGTSDWVTIDQPMINAFADATGDHQWIHVDIERAKKELPGGKTIAHGFLTLSLLPRLMADIYRIRHTSRGINYGSNKVRFPQPLPVGTRVRAHSTLVD